jgi:hypothetical protein
MSQSRQDACHTQLDVTPRLTLRCNDWTFLSNYFYFLLVINTLLLHYTSHLNDTSGRIPKNAATELEISYLNTLECRCVADNTQICLEHKVIKAHFAHGRYAVPSQERR